MSLWHRLLHRNPRKYPLPYGSLCAECDRQRMVRMFDMAFKGEAEAAAVAQVLREHRDGMRRYGL